MNCPHCGMAVSETARYCRSCGHPLEPADPAPAPATPPPPALPTPATATPSPPTAARAARRPDRRGGPAAARSWARSRRGRTLAGVAAAVVLACCLLGYFAVMAVNDTRYPPERPVRDLFTALTNRDAAQAGQLAGCVSSPACRGQALAAGYEPPTDVRIDKASYGDPTDATRRPNKAIAYVPVTYRLAGAEHTTTVKVQRASAGLARPWQVNAGATGRLTVVASHVEHVQLAGAVVPVDKSGSSLAVLPGAYTAQADPDDPLYSQDGGPTRVTVNATLDDKATPTELRLTLRIRPEVVEQVTTQVRAQLAECAKQEDLKPTGCPFGVSGIVIGAEDVRWTLDRQPVIEIVPGDDKPGAAPATVRTVTSGQATAMYTAYVSAGGDREQITAQQQIEVVGPVTLDPADPSRIIWQG